MHAVNGFIRCHLGAFVGYGTAIAIGIFVTIAARALHWSGATTAVVGGALAVLLGLLGTPLVVLSKRGDLSGDKLEVSGRGSKRMPTTQSPGGRGLANPHVRHDARLAARLGVWEEPKPMAVAMYVNRRPIRRAKEVPERVPSREDGPVAHLERYQFEVAIVENYEPPRVRPTLALSQK